LLISQEMAAAYMASAQPEEEGEKTTARREYVFSAISEAPRHLPSIQGSRVPPEPYMPLQTWRVSLSSELRGTVRPQYFGIMREGRHQHLVRFGSRCEGQATAQQASH
jgi:hypothetical protein